MILVCLVALFGTILQVHGRFAPAAAMPILLNLFNIAAFTWIMLSAHKDPEALRRALPIAAWSVVVAGVWQCVSQGGLMLRHQPLTLCFTGTGPSLRAMLRPFVPMFLALSVFQLNTWVDANLAEFLSPKSGGPDHLHLLGWVTAFPLKPGSLAAVMRTQLLYQFPLGVFGISIATAVFPALAHAATDPGPAGRQKFSAILRDGLRLTVFIGLPASVGLLLVRLPICRVIFQGGMFKVKDSELCARILAAYAPAIWAYSMTHVLTRGFFAMKDSRTPMIVSLGMVALNFLLNITLVWYLGIIALALSTAICAAIQCGLMILLISRKVERPLDRGVLLSWGRTALLSALMAAVIGPIACFWQPRSVHGSAAALAVMVVLGAAVFLAGALLLHCEELAWLKKRRVE
jgi:putative peptidoglycan lipid II flippase